MPVDTHMHVAARRAQHFPRPHGAPPTTGSAHRHQGVPRSSGGPGDAISPAQTCGTLLDLLYRTVRVAALLCVISCSSMRIDGQYIYGLFPPAHAIVDGCLRYMG